MSALPRALRLQVLASFKNVHRARLQVFAGDDETLATCREKINSEFRKHVDVTEEKGILELVKTANDSAEYLRKMVVQAKLNEESDVYEVKITKDTLLEENMPFLGGEYAPQRPKKGRRSQRKENPDSTCS